MVKKYVISDRFDLVDLFSCGFWIIPSKITPPVIHDARQEY